MEHPEKGTEEKCRNAKLQSSKIHLLRNRKKENGKIEKTRCLKRGI